MKKYHLKIPLEDKDIEKIKIGDFVYFSGKAFTCRSRLQRYIFNEKHLLPFPIKDRNVLIHVGPIVRKKDHHWKLISFMPTSSIRFEKWGAKSVKEWGVKAIIGKTTMGDKTMGAMKENKCIHVSPLCVSPNLWIDSISIKNVFLYEELGSIEAAWQLELNNLGPFLVDIDCQGKNYFEHMDMVVERNKKKTYQMLEIPEDFKYTKLY